VFERGRRISRRGRTSDDPKIIDEPATPWE